MQAELEELSLEGSFQRLSDKDALLVGGMSEVHEDDFPHRFEALY